MTQMRVVPDKGQDKLFIPAIITCALSAWALLVWGWIASFPGVEMSTWPNAVGAFLSAPIVLCVVAVVTVFAFEVHPGARPYSIKWKDGVAMAVLAVVTILLPSVLSHVSILLEIKQGNLARQLWDFRFWSLPSAITILGFTALTRECSRP